LKDTIKQDNEEYIMDFELKKEVHEEAMLAIGDHKREEKEKSKR
jgi:hypothetical protein